jgi:dolichol-phosphate mannosyltransferase
MIELSLIIPAYREEENLRLVLPRVQKTLSQQGFSYEVLVVDTQSPLDKTAEACAENKVTYVPRENGNVYADAVRTGIKHASGKFILFMDADGSHTPEYIPELLKFRNDYDIVAASRYITGGDTENPKILIFLSWVVNAIYGLVLGIRIKDISNSFKLYRAEQIKTLELYCDHFDIIEEVIFKLHKKYKIRVKEVPFTFKKRLFGESKRNLITFMIGYFFTLLKLRFGK